MCWMHILFHHFGMNTFFIPLPISLYAWRKVNTYFSEKKMWYKTDYLKIIDLMAPHSRSLAWKIPWMEEPGRLQSMESLRVGHDWNDLAAAADLSSPGSSAHGIFLVRILEWVAMSFSMGPFWPRDWKQCLLSLLHCRQIPYLLNHWGSPMRGAG